MAFRVLGSERLAYVVEVNDARGDLVDLLYYCYADAPTTNSYLEWPAYEWPDYCVSCEECSTLLNRGQECECEGEHSS
jgi:hypothetical protein